ncbi:MAG TPA: S9 family peptidase [Miltoncostaeaceae bacterium]|nr:S9 family peptidase [Miltoncostaeaceae bacterium]
MARPLAPDDLFRLRWVSDVVLLPDGERVVYTVVGMEREADEYRSSLWIFDGEGNRQLTFGPRDRRPELSPDGLSIAYLTGPGRGPAQAAVLPLEGGAPRVVTDRPDGVSEVRWAADASIVVVAPTRPADQDGVDDEELRRRPRRIQRMPYRFNDRGWIHDRPRHLYLVQLVEPGIPAARPLTDGHYDDWGAAPHPTEPVVAFVSQRHATGETDGGTDVYAVDLVGGEPRRLTGTDGNWDFPAWWPDGSRLLVTGFAPRLEVRLQRPHVVDAAGGECVPLSPDDVAGFVYGGPEPRPRFVPGGVLLHAHRQGRVEVDRVGEDGRRVTVAGGDRQVGAFDALPAGDALAFVASSPGRPAELHLVRDGEEERLSDLADELLAEVDLVEPEETWVTSADGTKVHTWIYRPPPSATPSGAAVLNVHGGPQAQYGWGFFDEFQMYAAAGHVVVASNPRGSDGYGEAWARAIVGDLGNLDWADVQAVADTAAGLPEVDPARVGIMGGSYGGFMAAWATSHSDRFACSIVERAALNFETIQGTSDIGLWFGPFLLGGTTLDHDDRLRRQSPITHAARIRTPTLIVHSEEDWRCPPEQAEQLFALLRLVGTEVELVRFPGESHELTRTGAPRHRHERFEIVLEWLARHLRDGAGPGA